MTSNIIYSSSWKRSGPDITNHWFKYKQTWKQLDIIYKPEAFFSCSDVWKFKCNAIEMILRKDIDELLLQAKMAELKKVAAIMKVTLDEEENL